MALLLSAASAGRAHAQDVLDEGPTSTLPEQPTQPAPPPAEQAPSLSPAEADKQARALFQQGKSAYEEGRYRDAWDYFRRAYLLSKRPALLYNVGQSADRMRMDREALEAFRLYLKRVPAADNRREVENRVRALEERLREAGAEPSETPGPEELGPAPAEATLGEGKNETEIFGSTQPPAPPPPSDGQPERKGLYVRLGLGVGLLHDGIGGGGFDAAVNSTSLAAQVGVGYDVANGLVVGGALLVDWSLAPSAHAGSGASSDIKSANLSMLAVFLDYFFEPRQDGWHVLAALGAAAFGLSDTTATVGNNTSHGGALIAGGGYEWPLDRQWALGVLGRIVLAQLAEDPHHHTIIAPSVACTAAWY
jgi:hypothetical protein